MIGKTGILIQPATKQKPECSLRFEQFAEMVEKALQATPEGLSWAKIRELTGLPRSKPSAYWVKRMEEERGLARVFDSTTSRFIWKLTLKKGLEKWMPPDTLPVLAEVKYREDHQVAHTI